MDPILRARKTRLRTAESWHVADPSQMLHICHTSSFVSSCPGKDEAIAHFCISLMPRTASCVERHLENVCPGKQGQDEGCRDSAVNEYQGASGFPGHPGFRLVLGRAETGIT